MVIDVARDGARAPTMGRKKSITPMGPILAKNFKRLGYEDSTVRVTEIAEKVKAKTGRAMSRQRISAILNAVSVSEETIKLLADAIGVKPEELTKP